MIEIVREELKIQLLGLVAVLSETYICRRYGGLSRHGFLASDWSLFTFGNSFLGPRLVSCPWYILSSSYVVVFFDILGGSLQKSLIKYRFITM